MSTPVEDEESSDDEMGPMPVGAGAAAAAPPKKKRKLEFESLYLEQIPSADMYEKSYMHRDVVTHTVVAAKAEFIITGSRDGCVKFWKKNPGGIYFVKNYKAHLKAIQCLSLSVDNSRLCSTSIDNTIKIFDVLGFDMINMINVEYTPNQSVWVAQHNSARNTVAVSDLTSPKVFVYHDECDDSKPLYCIELHSAPVTCMAFNVSANVVVAGDEAGMIEYWDCETKQTPAKPKIKYEYKMETDLYALVKDKTRATSISFPMQYDTFCVTSSDSQIRIFHFASGKLKRKYDESIVAQEQRFKDGYTLGIDPIDFGRRVAHEKEYLALLEKQQSTGRQIANCVYDSSGNFLFVPTLVGVKVVNLVTNKTVRVLGRVESGERFLSLSLYQGTPKQDHQMAHALGGSNTDSIADRKQNTTLTQTDPTLFCAAFNKDRFYLFSKREPTDPSSQSDGRDVFNEKPKQDAAAAKQTKVLARQATIHTTYGDIVVKLFPDECPRTVENFTVHAQKGYYSNTIFHRVIKDFMIQGGDPEGDGTGGESIWGGEFEDEFHRNLRHDRPYTLSMANAGPGTNGSQFFITTQAAPWLDNKHTVFGRVSKGMDIVHKIENTRCDNRDRPLEKIEVVSIQPHIQMAST